MPLSRTERVRFCPGIQGGNEWNGAAFHPALNTLYTGAVDWCASVQLAEQPSVPSAGAIWFGSAIGEIQGPASEAKGWITAFDADSGAVRWKFAAPAPVVAGVTPTAGGLVFSADLTGTLARVRRRKRRGALRARDGPVDRRRNRQLFGRRASSESAWHPA